MRDDKTLVQSLQPTWRWVLAAASMFSGAALIASIYVNVPLSITLALLGLCALLTIGYFWSRVTVDEQQFFKQKLLTGIIAGIPATICYDVSRWLLVQVGSLSVSPFEAFRIFGELIIGPADPNALFAVGATYHLLNGILFSIAYVFLLGNRHWTFGILWGLLLEAAMLTVYPGWLNLEDVLAEFISMSVLGHFVYGSVLGLITQYRFNLQSSSQATNSTAR